MSQLAETVATVLDGWTDLPFAFFGHSMGALLGFEVACVMRRRGGKLPFKLLVSARRAPQLPDDPPFFDWPEAELIREVQQRYGGISETIVNNRSLLDIYLPIMRADIEMIDTHQHQPVLPLPCAITAFGGVDDRLSEAELQGWSEQTSSTFRLRMLPGGHFFLQSNRDELLSAVNDELSDITEQRTAGS